MNLFPIDNRDSRKWHVVMVALTVFIYLSTCATVKAEPSFGNSFLFSFRQMPFEFSNGFAKGIKPCSQVMVDVIRPVRRDWINFFQFSMEGINDFFGSRIKNISFPQINSESQGKEQNNKSPATTKKPEVRRGESDSEDYHFLLSLVPMYFVLIFCVLYCLRYTQLKVDTKSGVFSHYKNTPLLGYFYNCTLKSKLNY